MLLIATRIASNKFLIPKHNIVKKNVSSLDNKRASEPRWKKPTTNPKAIE